MNRTLLLLPLLAAAALAGCNEQSHTITATSPDDDGATVNTAAVVLPPAIEASKSYRCKDNSLVYIDWLNDKKTADVRADTKTAEPTRVLAAEAGKAFVAEGYSLTGTSDGATITLERPGKGSQSCKA